MSNILNTKIIAFADNARGMLNELDIPAGVFDVAIVLDASSSMRHFYSEGHIQALLEKTFGLANELDENAELDVFIFGESASQLAPITADTLDGYVEREIIAKHELNQENHYAKAIECISNAYFDSENPTFVLFITDGDTRDKESAEAWVRQVCRNPHFFQFVGLGDGDFSFLRELDDLQDRAIDNCGFIQAESLFELNDRDLYRAVLTELPHWVQIAKARNWLE